MSTSKQTDQDKPDRVLKISEVTEITSLGRTTIYRRMASKTFPKKVSLGGNRVGWMESDINQWLEEGKRHTCAG